jgi:RinA family phage transcriptional activator
VWDKLLDTEGEDKMRIPKHVQKYIEGELINYSINKKALDQAKQNVYLQHSASGYTTLTQKSTSSTSPVEHKAMYLMSDRNILRLENSVNAVEDVLSELPDEYQKLIELRYFKSYSIERVAQELSICVRNFFNWRDKAIQVFAIRFGLA